MHVPLAHALNAGKLGVIANPIAPISSADEWILVPPVQPRIAVVMHLATGKRSFHCVEKILCVLRRSRTVGSGSGKSIRASGVARRELVQNACRSLLRNGRIPRQLEIIRPGVAGSTPVILLTPRPAVELECQLGV